MREMRIGRERESRGEHLSLKERVRDRSGEEETGKQRVEERQKRCWERETT